LIKKDLVFTKLLADDVHPGDQAVVEDRGRRHAIVDGLAHQVAGALVLALLQSAGYLGQDLHERLPSSSA
jgi:hypothetical protein